MLAFAVSRRTREIGVRMALGAQSIDVLKLVVTQGLRLVLAGAAIGLFTATDPLTFTAVVVLLVFVALLACLIPARRATKVDPMIALRYE